MANQTDRRSLLEVPSRARGSVRSTHTDVFSDEFALEEPNEVIDGYQEIRLDRDDGHDGNPVSVPSRRSSSRQQSFESRTRRSRASQRSETGSSIAPALNEHASRVSHPPRSVASVSDAGNSTPARQVSIRTQRTSGSFRAQSPYQGATGPSHPYAMYPQDIGLSRTPSLATTSTMRRPERSYSGPNGPTQPYGMYPQNTVPEAEQVSVAGFSGMDLEYHRRLGPDGEDIDDLIGPDGYAEQLPPYTRFANGIPPKYTSGLGSVRRSGVPPNYMSEIGSIRRSAVPTVPGDSQETLNNSRHYPNDSSDNQVSTNPFGDSSTQLDSTIALAVLPKDEGGSFKERVREKSKRRLRVCCGVIPCWLLFVLAVVVILAVIMGGGIGGMIAHKHTEEATGYHQPEHTVTPAAASSAAPTATVTATSAPVPPDAVPLASTPADLPALPTGTFSVSLDNPVSYSNSCLTNSAQSSAWDCATGADLTMVVTMAGSNAPVISLSYATPSDGYIRYGSQPPQLNQPASLMLMKDKNDGNKGPAYYFQQQYDKLVIVHEEDIPGGIPSTQRSFLKRWFYDKELENRGILIGRQEDDEWSSNTIAHPIDKPWFCYWNNTIIEGFIFVTDDTSPSVSASASSSAAATSSGSVQPPGSRLKRQSPAIPSPYPKLVKIEERRPLNPSQPYCEQMQILYNYQPGPPLVNPATNQINTIYLNETESISLGLVQSTAMQRMPGGSPFPVPTASPPGPPKKRAAMNKRIAPASSCQCGWLTD